MIDVEQADGLSTPGSGGSSRALRLVFAPVLVGLALAASMVVALPGPSGADQISDLQAQAAQLEQQIQQTGQQIDALDQQYQGALLQKQSLDGQINTTKAKIAQTQRTISGDQRTLGKAAINAYVTAGSDSSQDALFSGDQSHQLAASVYSSVAEGDVGTAVDNLDTAQSQLNAQQAQLQSQDAQAQQAVQSASNSEAQAKSLEAQQQNDLNNDNGQIATLVAQQQAAQAAAAAQAAQAAKAAQAQQQAAQAAPSAPTTTSGGSSASSGGSSGGSSEQVATASGTSGNAAAQVQAPPAPAGGGGPGGAGEAAVAAAETQIGVPYVWGGETPGVGFDCSGLVAWAWGQAGVPLPHYSGAQYSMSTPVSTSDLQPGDLLFYGPGGSDHVAMYVGGGQMIEAPYTGASVWITAVRLGDGFVGAGYP